MGTSIDWRAGGRICGTSSNSGGVAGYSSLQFSQRGQPARSPTGPVLSCPIKRAFSIRWPWPGRPPAHHTDAQDALVPPWLEHSLRQRWCTPSIRSNRKKESGPALRLAAKQALLSSPREKRAPDGGTDAEVKPGIALLMKKMPCRSCRCGVGRAYEPYRGTARIPPVGALLAATATTSPPAWARRSRRSHTRKVAARRCWRISSTPSPSRWKAAEKIVRKTR